MPQHVPFAKTKFLYFFSFIGASAIKVWEKSRIFRYGVLEEFLSKGQKPTPMD